MAPFIVGYTFYGSLERMCAPQKLKHEAAESSSPSIAHSEIAATAECEGVATASSTSEEGFRGAMPRGEWRGRDGAAIRINESNGTVLSWLL